MCNSLRFWMVPAFLAASVAGCNGSLVLPDDNSPADLVAVSGNGQEGTVGTRLDDPLVVRLTDASSQPIEGVAVEFLFEGDAEDAVITPQALTDSKGEAAATVRLGTEAGPVTVLAQVTETPSGDLRATFGLMAIEKGKKGKGGGRGRDRDDEDEDEEEED